MIASTLLILALATSGQDAVQSAGAPQAPEGALYCLRVEAALGTRLETIQCHTRAEWAELEVDVDKDWAEEGVRVIENQAG